MGLFQSPPLGKQRILLKCLLTPAPARQCGVWQPIARNDRKARKQRAFTHSRAVSRLPFPRFRRPNYRKSPASSANIPVLRRLSLETWFECNCRPTAAVLSSRGARERRNASLQLFADLIETRMSAAVIKLGSRCSGGSNRADDLIALLDHRRPAQGQREEGQAAARVAALAPRVAQPRRHR